MNEEIRIPKPALFNFAESIWFLDRDLDDCMHSVNGQTVTRALKVNGKHYLIEVSEEPGWVVVKVLQGNSSPAITRFVKQWLDLDRDIAPFYTLLKKDTDLSFLADSFRGFRMVGIPHLFEALCWCIIGQQINLAFAYKTKRKLVERYGETIRYKGRTFYLFPEPSILATLEPHALKELQLTTRKAEYITGIARLFECGALSREKLLKKGEEALMLKELLAIRGIGEWTANYTVMKSLGGMNCIPYGDAGVHIALNKIKGIPKKNNRIYVDEVFNNFDGWKTYLVFYLWRFLRQPGGTII